MKDKRIYILITLLLATTLISPIRCEAKTYIIDTVPGIREEKTQDVTILVDINENTLFVLSDNVIALHH